MHFFKRKEPNLIHFEWVSRVNRHYLFNLSFWEICDFFGKQAVIWASGHSFFFEPSSFEIRLFWGFYDGKWSWYFLVFITWHFCCCSTKIDLYGKKEKKRKGIQFGQPRIISLVWDDGRLTQKPQYFFICLQTLLWVALYRMLHEIHLRPK